MRRSLTDREDLVMGSFERIQQFRNNVESSTRLSGLLLVGCLASLLSGCGFAGSAPPTPDAGVAISGSVHGGQQPISGAHVYLFAANTTGYGNPSVSLLTSAGNTTLDSSGGATNGDYYVSTGPDGSFTITGDYSCTANTQVYLYALGGNPGLASGTNNAASGLLAALGNCPSAGNFLSSTPFIAMNEVSTIAAAYAFAGFATDATHISSSGTALAQTGIQNAFANAANLANISTGAALAITPAGNGAVPQAEINTLGNILATCINSAGTVTGPANPTACYSLFTSALSAGSSGSIPSDTATAAINIAHNPGVNVATLYALSTSTPPFAPALGTRPNDFTIALAFAGGGLEYGNGGIADSTSVAIDSSGNAWIANLNSGISKFSPAGVALSPANTGFLGGGLSGSLGIAIDLSGNVWATNNATSSVSEFSAGGTPVSPSTGFTGGGLFRPFGIAIDASGDAWIADYATSITKLSSTGAAISPASGFTGGGLLAPGAMALDPSGDAWVAFGGGVAEFSNSGTAISPSTGFGVANNSGLYGIAIDASGDVWATNYDPYTVTELSSSGAFVSPPTGFAGGGLAGPRAIAMDGSGNAWIANGPNLTATSRISEISSSGTPISPSTGFTGGSMANPYGIAVDGSGNVWVANYGTYFVTEFIGAATPVVTPLAYGVKNKTLGTRP
jgi:streptogramin lyase